MLRWINKGNNLSGFYKVCSYKVKNVSSIYISYKLSLIWLKNKLGIFWYDIKSKFFFYKNDSGEIVFIFFSRLDFLYIFRIILNNFNLGGYFFEVKLYGIGFGIKKLLGSYIKNFFLLDVGFNHKIYCFFFNCNNVIIRVGLNFILFFSIYRCILFDLLVCLLFIKWVNCYKLKGIVYPKQIIFIKEGKKRV